ncbi:MAG: tricarboxylate transporter, partial [Rhodospirillales bacterium]
MTSRTRKTLGTLGVAAFAAGALLSPTAASAVDFSGKRVTAIVPFSEGGGTDKIVRMFAPYFAKYLPGEPTIIIRNMPGGGSIRGNNYFHREAKPDGLWFTGVSTSSQTGFVLGGSKVKYDLLKWKYILMTPRGTVFYVRPETGVKGKDVKADVMALRNTELVFGAKNPTAAELRGFLAYELLGIKNVKAVFGLSTGKQRKALLRGETNINYDSGGAYLTKVKKKYADTGKVIPLMTLGFTKNGEIVRDPGYPKMPTVLDAYKAIHGKMPSG